MADHRGSRADRVRDQIRAEVADILLRRVKDPRIGFATVTHVALTDDLRHARVFVSVMGETTGKDAALKGISSASGFIRGELGRRLKLRYVPDLVFILDETAEGADRVMKILSDLEKDA